MKNVTVTLALVLGLFTGLNLAQAQVFGGGGGGAAAGGGGGGGAGGGGCWPNAGKGGGASTGGGSSTGGGNGGSSSSGTSPTSSSSSNSGAACEPQTVVLRYYGDQYPSAVEAALKRVTGVANVEIDRATRAIRVNFTGGLKRTGAVEAGAAGTGVPVAMVSHARLQAFFKALGKDADLKQLEKDLSTMEGMKSVRVVSGAAVELCADLDTLDAGTLKEIADKSGFELKLANHEWVSLAVPGATTTELEKQLVATRGILSVRAATDTVGMWTVKKIGDLVFKKLGEKCGVEIGEIARL